WDYRGIGARMAVFDGLPCRLGGGHQVANATLAVATLEAVADALPVSEEAIRQGLAAVRWPGRMEYFCLDAVTGAEVSCQAGAAGDGTGRNLRRYLLDGAHNPAGVEALRKALSDAFPHDRVIMIWASMSDKDIAPMLAAIAPLCARIIFTRPECERSAQAAHLIELLPDTCKERAAGADTVAEALAFAAREADSGDLIVVAGSLYLIGAARKLLLGEVVR
ncbi:MAG: bifunctional folylpolyglutamate synthase/dihydrofolate synthase, partial [Desulfobulbaceae bacterium]|nr:bifunctional folylpolyglutamate synthase/dihydrofolate synthase [Desulfobulbaceae bacterium]